MAAGDLVLFEEFTLALNEGDHNLETDTLRCGFVSVAPTASMVAPIWPGSFTVVNGGNFPATPATIATTVTEVGGLTTVTCDTNLSMASNASNPTSITHAVLYNSTSATVGQAIAYIEIDAAGANGVNGLISLTWGADLYQCSIV